MGEIPGAAATTRTTRLLSIDALRGFDMFCIMGGDALVQAIARWANQPVTNELAEQFEHVPWEGFHFYDLIFPLFLFVVGAVIPFSFAKVQETGESRAWLYGRIIRRTILLFALGLLCNGILQFNFADLRIA